MNTEVEVVVVTGTARATAAAEAFERVEALFHDTESRLSRFLPSSELCALNATAGHAFAASPVLFAAVSAAIDAARTTLGLFDPTILDALVAAGYDRSFELLPPDRMGTPTPPGSGPDWSAIALDAATRTILLPMGCSIDLGGIGKGLTLDRSAALLGRFRDFAIDAGGDMVLAGTQADGSRWGVGVQDPTSPSCDLTRLECTDCAVATSTIARRHWLKGSRPQHHLIDPRTGLPSESGAVATTVIARSAAQAETLAKAALLLGPSAGIRFLDGQPNVEGLVVLEGGYVQRSAGLDGLLLVA
ncbi:MAG TPA: FAD:protein FMN transferase [Dehalococcoidia bacterium]|nr:FAD:protein FMN transferase [Dehalococcoidia bacterium]